MSTIEENLSVATETSESAPVLTLTPRRQTGAYLIRKRAIRRSACASASRAAVAPVFSYVLNLEPEARANDLTYEQEGIRVFIDPKSAKFLQDTTLDFSIKNILEGGWIFQNPNAGRTCGCGTSFTPK